MSKNPIIRGTFILTVTGLSTRVIGFFFRIFMSHNFGEEQMGLYQLIFPIYALCFSFSCAGIETALSRSVAKKMVQGRRKEADLLLYRSVLVSLILSLLLVLSTHTFAKPISQYILHDMRCELLLKTLMWSLPFASIHSCICGYYLGRKQTKVPAISQFIEQLCRVGIVCGLFYFLSNNGKHAPIHLAVIGIVCGEFFAFAYCFQYFYARKHSAFALTFKRTHTTDFQELFHMAIPLTTNRLVINVFQSIEAISIPIFLQRYGFANVDALSTYGVLTGMALPCILFPTAITNSISTMLLPTVAEIEAANNLNKLKTVIRRVIFFGMLLGSICSAFFLLFGSFIGQVLFKSTLAGNFLQTLAWICPFLYLNGTLFSILNGLGKATHSFFINVTGLTIRILGVWYGISHFGMNGYLIGLLISQLVVTLLCILQFNSHIAKRELY